MLKDVLSKKDVNFTKIEGKFINFAEIKGKIYKFCGNRGVYAMCIIGLGDGCPCIMSVNSN